MDAGVKPDRRRLTIRRSGALLIGLTLTVGLAAVNTGNNLLFLLLATQLSTILVSGVLSELSLRRLQVVRRLPKRVTAKKIFSVTFTLTNKSRWLPVLSLSLRDQIDESPFRRSAFFLRLAPGESRAISYRCEVQHRGTIHFNGVLVSTRFPFGLFEKSTFVPLAETLLAHPASIPLTLPTGLGAGILAEGTIGRGQGGLEFDHPRPYAPGDDPRRIHWKKSAQGDDLQVVVSGQPQVPLINLVVTIDGIDPEIDELIVRTGAEAARLFQSRGQPFCLWAAGRQVVVGAQRSNLILALDLLALLQPEDPSPPLTHPTTGTLEAGPGWLTAAGPANRTNRGRHAV